MAYTIPYKFEHLTGMTNEGAIGRDNEGFKRYELYVLSDEEIKKGDWAILLSDGTIFQWNDDPWLKAADKDNYRKIIATTDTALKVAAAKGHECSAFRSDDYQYSSECGWCGSSWDKCLQSLPGLSDGFIQKYVEKYNAGQQIKEVMVEYEVNTVQVYPRSGRDFQGNERYEDLTQLRVRKDNTIITSAVKEVFTREDMLKAFGAGISSTHGYVESFDQWLDEHY